MLTPRDEPYGLDLERRTGPVRRTYQEPAAASRHHRAGSAEGVRLRVSRNERSRERPGECLGQLRFEREIDGVRAAQDGCRLAAFGNTHAKLDLVDGVGLGQLGDLDSQNGGRHGRTPGETAIPHREVRHPGAGDPAGRSGGTVKPPLEPRRRRSRYYPVLNKLRTVEIDESNGGGRPRLAAASRQQEQSEGGAA